MRYWVTTRRFEGADNPDPPASVTVTAVPATVTVPEREAAPVFAAALIVTVPLPLPLAPLWTVSHGALPAAVHVHPLPAVTLTVVVPPAAGRLRVVGDTVKPQLPA